MSNEAKQWTLWAITMLVFLALAMSGHPWLLGAAIVTVAVFRNGIVRKAGAGRE